MRFLFCMLIIFSSLMSFGQSFFKPLPKIKQEPVGRYSLRQVMTPYSSPVLKDSTIWAFRPVANVAGISYPGRQALIGGGIAYEKLIYNPNTSRWTCPFAVMAITWIGANLTPQSDSGLTTYGLAVGFLNNLITMGAGHNAGAKINPFQIILGISVNFNN